MFGVYAGRDCIVRRYYVTCLNLWFSRWTFCISMPDTSTDTGSTAGRQSNTMAHAAISGSCSVSRGATCVAVFCIHLCDRWRRPGGLSLACKSSVMPDTCVTRGHTCVNPTSLNNRASFEMPERLGDRDSAYCSRVTVHGGKSFCNEARLISPCTW